MSELKTVSQIAKALSEQRNRVTYIIEKYGLEPDMRIGMARLFNEEKVEAIKQVLYGLQIRKGR